MALLRRDTARNLLRAMWDYDTFTDAVANEISSKRIKRKVGEKLIVKYYCEQDWVWRRLEEALGTL